MNRRLQISGRRRKLEFINETLEAPEADDGADNGTLTLAKFRQTHHNFSTAPGLSDDINISETKRSDIEKAQFNDDIVNTMNACLKTAETDKVSCDEDLKSYLNVFGLTSFSSFRVSEDTDEFQTKSETDINNYESLMEDDTIENSDAKVETDIANDLESSDSQPFSKYHRFYHKPVDKNFSGDESTEVDDNNDVYDDGDGDNKEEYGDDDDDYHRRHCRRQRRRHDDGDDDSVDDESDDSDGDSDDDSDDDESDDNDDGNGHNNGRCAEESTDKIDTKADEVYGGDHDGKASKEHVKTHSSHKFRRKDRHKDIEAHIKRHIMEIKRKMAILKQRENKKRKRYTKCTNLKTVNGPVGQLQIQPIQRSKRLAEPIRCAILKRRALRNAWQGCRGSCCGKGCWAKWGWVNIKRVLSDYW